MSIAKSLKKLAVRLTNAEDLTAVEGQSIADVFNFIGDNLNTDSSGKLLVKEYKEPSQPSEGGGGNLLKTAYKFAEVWNANPSETNILIDRLGLVPGKTYKVTGYYGGESLDSDVGATRFELTEVALDGKEMDMDDVALLDFSESVSTNGTLSIGVYDGVYIDMSNGTPVVDSSKGMLSFGYSGGDSDRPYAKNFVVESITEA